MVNITINLYNIKIHIGAFKIIILYKLGQKHNYGMLLHVIPRITQKRASTYFISANSRALPLITFLIQTCL